MNNLNSQQAWVDIKISEVVFTLNANTKPDSLFDYNVFLLTEGKIASEEDILSNRNSQSNLVDFVVTDNRYSARINLENIGAKYNELVVMFSTNEISPITNFADFTSVFSILDKEQKVLASFSINEKNGKFILLGSLVRLNDAWVFVPKGETFESNDLNDLVSQYV